MAFAAPIPTGSTAQNGNLATRAAATKALVSVYNLSNAAKPTFMGYLNAVNGYTYGLTSDPNSATVVSAQLGDLNPGDISLVTENYGYPVLGLSGNYTSIGSGSYNFAFLAAANPVPKNSPAQQTSSQSITKGGRQLPTQTAVWSLEDSDSLTIKPTWINPNGSPVKTTLAYVPYFKNFIVTGDRKALAAWDLQAISIPVVSSPSRIVISDSGKITAPTPCSERPSFTRQARDLATASTPQSQSGPSSQPLFKRSLAFFKKLQDLKYLFHSSGSQEGAKGSDGMTQDDLFDQQPQTPRPGSLSLSLSTADLKPFTSVKAGEEGSAASTPPTTFSAATSVRLGTPPSVSTTPTSTFTSGPSSPQSFDQHPDLIAVNRRIAELEALSEQIEQEHVEYVKNAREMEAISTALEEEVVSAIDAIKAVNRQTSLEDEENLKWDIERLAEIRHREIAEAFIEDAKREYEEGQKKYAKLQDRFENLKRERKQRRIDLANAMRPSEPWLEIVSTAVAPSLLGGVAFGIGHIVGPFLSNAF
ncbi:hypothetical protein FRC00_005501 [Tulasnella sp. 408]|nr:hypothetical protein FRC00_005501 [Tulasnella sp. 408]